MKKKRAQTILTPYANRFIVDLWETTTDQLVEKAIERMVKDGDTSLIEEGEYDHMLVGVWCR